jgi:hypothetical protein
VLGAKHIVQCLKAREEVRAILTQMEGVATALINLAYYEVQGKSKCELLKCLICSVNKSFLLHMYVMYGRDHWEDQDVGGWTILKWILER